MPVISRYANIISNNAKNINSTIQAILFYCRRLRANLRAQGKPLTSMALADGLIRYSERGQEYVDTLKSIIRVNGLAIADDARFRDEPMRFAVGAESTERAAELRTEIERLRAFGELVQIIQRMRLK